MSDEVRFPQAMREVIRVALPLLISTGTFSLVLFADRTLLLWYQSGMEMSAAMAAGNLYWTLVCMPVGIASMTGAITAQLVGSGRERQVGRFLWQSVWFALAVTPIFFLFARFAPDMFRLSGQPAELIDAEAAYLRILLVGGLGTVLETALSGFFSGTQRTRVIMWASIVVSLLNIVLDVWFIFGGLGVPEMGIRGAALASVIAFWTKAAIYVSLLSAPAFRRRYGIYTGLSADRALFFKLIYYGTPAGLQFLTEAGIFTLIVLQIGQLGDLPLRATTMAINFNMIAFIPLVGVSIAASVLVGHHLTSTGVRGAILATRAALVIAIGYSTLWAAAYVLAPRGLLALYLLGQHDAGTLHAVELAEILLRFVAIYVFFDSAQLILSGALRGAGDTWFVLAAAATVSAISFTVGKLAKPLAVDGLGIAPLHWWWAIITLWVLLLTAAMILRYRGGRWQTMRMVE